MQLAYSNSSLFSAGEKKLRNLNKFPENFKTDERRWYENDCSAHLIKINEFQTWNFVVSISIQRRCCVWENGRCLYASNHKINIHVVYKHSNCRVETLMTVFCDSIPNNTIYKQMNTDKDTTYYKTFNTSFQSHSKPIPRVPNLLCQTIVAGLCAVNQLMHIKFAVYSQFHSTSGLF